MNRSTVLSLLLLVHAASFSAAAQTVPIRRGVKPGSGASGPFPITHQCHWQPATRGCDTLRNIMQPDWTKAEDLVILPHRGYWGFGYYTAIPENSAQGYVNVANEGYVASEVDFMPTSDGLVMSHDYVLYRVADAPPGDPRRIYEMSTSEITRISQRDRFGNIATSSKMLSARDAFVHFKRGNPVHPTPPLIFADIKQRPAPNDPDRNAQNWVDALSEILRQAPVDQLYQIVVKTPYSPNYILEKMAPDIEGRFLEILWMPQVASNEYYAQGAPGMGGDVVANSADFVDLWAGTGAVAAYETNWKSPDDSRLQRFVRAMVSYSNILDYIKQTTGRRGGVFAEEPVGARGIVNREARWTIKNARTDMRGDFVFEALAPEWGRFMVVTTDRPDVWRDVSKALETPFATQTTPEPVFLKDQKEQRP